MDTLYTGRCLLIEFPKSVGARDFLQLRLRPAADLGTVTALIGKASAFLGALNGRPDEHYIFKYW